MKAQAKITDYDCDSDENYPNSIYVKFFTYCESYYFEKNEVDLAFYCWIIRCSVILQKDYESCIGFLFELCEKEQIFQDIVYTMAPIYSNDNPDDNELYYILDIYTHSKESKVIT
jgi:hypothetical protein